MNTVILLAAGASRRMKREKNKCLLQLGNKAVIEYSLEKFQNSKIIDRIIVISRAQELSVLKKLIKQKYSKVTAVIKGGALRQDSVELGLKRADAQGMQSQDIVIVHNSANPFFSERELGEVVKYAKYYGAAAVGQCSKDTIKEVREHNNLLEVVKTWPRDNLVQMQTPQAIRFGLFCDAFRAAKRDRFQGTDDVSLVERIGRPVIIVEAAAENFKITDSNDWKRALAVISDYESVFRSGIGLDSHRFIKGLKGMTLGGLYLENEPKFEANSDGDVVLHALFNAISSALGGRSLSKVADTMCLKKGITDSKEYLKELLRVHQDKFEIVNVSLTMECARPKIEPLIAAMKKSLGGILKIRPQQIGITATSGEGLTEFGKGRGVQCLAAVSLRIWELMGNAY